MRTKSKILKLYPFLQNDILHVGGQFAHAEMPDEARHPETVPQTSLAIHDDHLNFVRGRNQMIADFFVKVILESPQKQTDLYSCALPVGQSTWRSPLISQPRLLVPH